MKAHAQTLTALLLTAVVSVAAPAAAQDSFPDKDACLQKAFDLAGSAEKKGLSDDKLAAIDPLLEELEGACEAGDFAAAAATAKEIEAKIGG